MPLKLYRTTDRDRSHQALSAALAHGAFPKAECRERDEEGRYTVWTGPADAETPAADAPAVLDARAAIINQCGAED